MNKILIIIIMSVSSLFASERSVNSVKVLNETTVGAGSYNQYIIQTICKDGYEYTVVIKGSSISITQDLEAFSSTSTTPRVIKCDKNDN